MFVFIIFYIIKLSHGTEKLSIHLDLSFCNFRIRETEEEPFAITVNIPSAFMMFECTLAKTLR